LIQEIEKKKRKEGVKPEVKLTKKQHEVMAAQLAKESEIRAKAKQVQCSPVIKMSVTALRQIMPHNLTI
jgi:hypothetical protein